MKKRSKNYTLSPPINYWFLLTIFLCVILIFFSSLLIKERLFSQEMKVILERYKIYLNTLLELNSKLTNSHLSQPTNPSSSSQILYLKLENFTLK